MTDKGLPKVVKNNWVKENSVMENAKRMSGVISEWNKTSFGNIHQKKRRLLARIQGFQHVVMNMPNNVLFKLEKRLTKELDEVLKQEELLWFQKSGEEWITSGDRNTKYYHASTIVKRNWSKCDSLKDNDEKVITDKEEIKALIRNYYNDLFNRDGACALESAPKSCFPSIPPNVKVDIFKEITNSYVEKAIFDMSPFKAPGPDGLYATFYQKMWPSVGVSMCNLVKDFFRTSDMPASLNNTVITLIPKMKEPEKVTQFRPINLCNVSYKAITKVMTNKLKGLMKILVGPQQSSFVPGRQITDNIIIFPGSS